MEKNNHKDTIKKINILSLYDHVKFDAILDKIPDERSRLILRLRHDEYLPWKHIFEKLSVYYGYYYCTRHIYRIYAKGLKFIEEGGYLD